MSSCLALVLALSGVEGMLVPQDLIEREKALRRQLPPSVDRSDVKPKRASLVVDANPDFACGSFDLKASFRSLFNKNVKEEFLGGSLRGLQTELASSALVLACYASPTVCDAIKHYRISANAMLGTQLDLCRSIEQALDGLDRRSQARALKECLDEKARQGVPLDEAQKACQHATRIRGLDGKPVQEIDLLKQLGLSDSLVPSLTIGAGRVKAESRATAVVEAYEAKRQERLRAWQAAFKDPSRVETDKLGPVSRAEVERIAAMEPARREAVARSLASAQALSDLVKEAHEAERALESAELLASPEVRGEVERRRAQLRNEIGRLVESFEMERRLNVAVEEAQAAAAAEVAGKARDRLAARRAQDAKDSMTEQTRPWGCDVKKGSEHDAKR